MTRFEPGSADIGSDRAINCAPTTAQFLIAKILFSRIRTHELIFQGTRHKTGTSFAGSLQL